MTATAERTVLLCTDLHAGNALAAERESWLVIDPKPHVVMLWLFARCMQESTDRPELADLARRIAPA